MLGKLAKWLRVLGFDTLFFSRIEDDDILHLAKEEERILLTRDNELYRKANANQALFIHSDEWPEQLKQVIEKYRLRSKVSLYSLCIECNLPLKTITKSRAKNLVTPFVYGYADTFSLCPKCDRVYWKGTHHQDMATRIEEILENKVE